jgi:integrase
VKSPEKFSSKRLDLVASQPEVLVLKSGATMVLLETLWICQDGVFRIYMDYSRVPAGYGALIPSFKNALRFYLRANSPAYCQNLFNSFIHFLTKIDGPVGDCRSVHLRQIQQFESRLESHEKPRINALNALLQKWHGLGLAGVHEECTNYLSERRKPGNTKDEAVRTQDPVKGPYSQQEYTALYRAFDVAYGQGNLYLWTFILARLLFAVGGRISQYASMKILDFVIANDESGRRIHQIKVPQVKKGLDHSRESFITFDLSSQTGNLILDYANELYAQGFTKDSALFPKELLFERITGVEGQLQFKGHCISSSLSALFSRCVKALSPSTERLNYGQIPISPQRFRYTFGTRMVEEGCSRAVVAERLGHSDLQNVDCYFEASPSIVDNIDAVMGGFLAPVAQAFCGRLVEDERSSTHGGAPGTRIVDFKVSTSGTGSCARDLCQGCGFDKPKACYTCFKFEPWLDGPHEKTGQFPLKGMF